MDDIDEQLPDNPEHDRPHRLRKTLLIGSIMVIAVNLMVIALLMPHMGQQKPQALPVPAYENALLNSYDKLSSISDNLQYVLNNSATLSPDAKRQVDIQVTSMRTVLEQAKQLVPPYEHDVAHMSFTRALRDLSWAADNIVPAITANDTALKDKCINRLVSGQQYLDQTVKRMEEGL